MTSNFLKSLWSGGTKTTILVAVACLLLLELIVRTTTFWTLDQTSSTGMVEPTVRASLERAPNPELVFLGSSRFRNGISPVVVAEQLGLQEGDVANISFSGGTPFDYVEVYRRNRDVLGKAKVLVINVGARDFNWGRASTVGNRFRQRASLSERMRVPDLQTRADVVGGWIWKTWDARSMLRGYGFSIARGNRSFEPLKANLDGLQRLNAIEDKPMSTPPRMQAVRYPYEVEFNEFAISTVHLDALSELVSMAKEDGLHVVLLETPLSPLTNQEIAKSFAKEDGIWRQEVLMATGLRVQSVPFNRAECSNWQDCYIDYGHMTMAGAKAYSEELGDWLSTKLATKLPSSQSLQVAGN